MRMQSHQNLCGFASLANCFRAIGKERITEDKLADAAKKAATATETPEQDGAGVRSLQLAAQAFGYVLVSYKLEDRSVAWPMLVHYLGEHKPAILSVDDNGHWVAAVGLIGDQVLIADPADAEIVRPYTRDKLDLRWRPDHYALFLWKQDRPRKKKGA